MSGDESDHVAITNPDQVLLWQRTHGPRGLDPGLRRHLGSAGVDKEELCVPAFEIFGTAVAEKHGDEDPAVVARRLYPEAGEYFGDLYPASVRRPPNPASFSRPDDVPF